MKRARRRLESNARGTRPDRRALLRWALGSTAAATTLGNLTQLQAAALRSAPQSGDYKALVCVFLFGGNDGFNLLVPRSGAAYSTYADSRQTLAVPAEDLLPVTPTTSDGNQYGLHPSLPQVRDLFDSGKLAVVANAGPLVAPMTKAQYENGSVAKPPQLFSHSDQMLQWQSPAADLLDGTGWAGRVADELQALNGGSDLSLNISLSGANLLQVGRDTSQYDLDVNGSVELTGFWGNSGAARYGAFRQLLDRSHAHVLERQYAKVLGESIEIDSLVSEALDAGPEMATTFDEESWLGLQLRMVAQMISVRASLGVSRQLFFVGLGGFDTHDNQLTSQPALFAEVSRALGDFQTALESLGADGDVVTFTASDFGRTLSSNGKGSDHGWGSHHFVMGTPVAGGDVYGTLPDLTLDGPDDAGRGRMIPTTSVDQYAATLARWFGVDEAALPLVLPNLPNFGTSDLGFL